MSLPPSSGNEQSNAYRDAANQKIDWVNNKADTANSFLNFQQTIVAPELKSETSFGSNGVAGSAFVFDYCGEVRGELDTDITDHYSESTVFVQDHAILKPRMITLRGFVGELVARPPTGVIALLNTLTGNLTAVSGYLGKYTPGAVATMQKATTQAQNVTNKINAIVAKGNGLLNLLGKNVAQSKQAQAWAKLETMWAARIPMTVFTPTKVYNNMLVKSVVWTNPESTKYWSEIAITMKEIRTTGTVTYKVEANTRAQQNYVMASSGAARGKVVNTSDLLTSFP
jgi:hypothetical protein